MALLVNDNTPRVQYTATASQTVFAYPFAIFVDADLKVYQTLSGADADDTADILTLTTDYTVSGAATTAGGNVTLVTGAAAGDIITIERDLAMERTTDYQVLGDFQAESINNDLDKLVMMAQQNESDLARTFKVRKSDFTVTDFDYPTPANGGYIRYNALGTGLEAGSLPTALTGDITAFDSIASLKAISSATDADLASVENYYSGIAGGGGQFYWDSSSTETDNSGTIIKATSITTGRWKRITHGFINIKDFGAKGDSVTDNTTVMQNALDFAANNISTVNYPQNIAGVNHNYGGKGVYFPSGTYLTTGLTMQSGVTIEGETAVSTTILVSGASSVGFTSTKEAGVFVVNDVVIKNIRIDSNGDATQSGIVFTDIDDCVFDNIIISDFATAGLHLKKSQYGKINGLKIFNCGTGILYDEDVSNFGCNNNAIYRTGIYGCTTGMDVVRGEGNDCFGLTIQNSSTVGLKIQANSNEFNVNGGHFEFHHAVYDIDNAGRNTTIQNVFFPIDVSLDTERKVKNTGTGVMALIGCSTQGADPVTISGSKAVLETDAVNGFYWVIGCKFGSTTRADEWVCNAAGSESAAKAFALVQRAASGQVIETYDTNKTRHAGADVSFSTSIVADTNNRWQVSGNGKIEMGSGSGAVDVSLFRQAADLLQTDDQFYAADGIRMKTKAGIPTDADTTVDASGVCILDTTNSRIYFRVGSTWKYAALV